MKFILATCLIVCWMAVAATMTSPEVRAAKQCEDCKARCKQTDTEEICPEDAACEPCYKKTLQAEKVALQKAEAKLDVDIQEIDKMGETATAVREAFKRMSKLTSDSKAIVNLVKKEVGENAYSKLADHIVKRKLWGVSLGW
jgi:hypothetical protein